MPLPADSGITHVVAQQPATKVLEKLLSLLEAKKIKVFAVVDHSGEAAIAGLTMPDTKVVVFGNPEVGTPLMQAVPDCALDLPLKLLIAEQPDGTTKIAYNSVSYLQERYDLGHDLATRLSAITQIAAAIAS